MGIFQTFDVTPPDGLKDKKFWGKAVKLQFTYSMSALAVGVICVLGGMLLFLHGIGGSTSWTTKALGLESEISDAAPGAVLFLVGLFIIGATRFNVGAQKK